MQSVTKAYMGRNKSHAKKEKEKEKRHQPNNSSLGGESTSRTNLPPHLAFESFLDKEREEKMEAWWGQMPMFF